jgi:hypothetical protein
MGSFDEQVRRRRDVARLEAEHAREVVRPPQLAGLEAPGPIADLGELLGLLEQLLAARSFVLRGPALRQVPDPGREQRWAVLRARDRDLDRKGVTARPRRRQPNAVIEQLRRATGEDPVQRVTVLIRGFGLQQERQRVASQRSRARPAEHLLGSEIQLHDMAALVDGEYRIQRRREGTI